MGEGNLFSSAIETSEPTHEQAAYGSDLEVGRMIADVVKNAKRV